MSTSGSTIFQMTRDQIISAAMRKIQALAKGQTPDTQDLTDFTLALNALIAEFQVDGMQLWARNTYSLPLISGQDTYIFGVGQAVNIPYPVKMHQGILQNTAGTGRIEMEMMSLYDFNLLPQNGTPIAMGQPSNMCYTPGINLGTLKVWPAPDATTAANYTLQLVYQRPFDKFIDAANTADFPEEWHNALIYGLASLIADELGIPTQDKQYMDSKAQKHHEMAKSGGVEEASMFVQPNGRDSYGIY